MSTELTREEAVSLVLHRCALQLDPRYGRLALLAEEFDLHPSTITYWMRNGRVPPKAARRLLRRFGKKLIDIDFLIG